MTELRALPAPATGGTALSSAGGGAVRRAGWAIAMAALIFWASSRSYVPSPGFTKVDDKFAHFAIYGLLGTLLCRIGRGGHAAFWAVLAASVFGASDEWHQSFVPGRSTDVRDWIADTLGAVLAVSLYAGWPRYRRVLERPLIGRRRRNENG